jgi:hypothetical protein
MSLKILQIIESELMSNKILAESSIEYLLMDKNLSPEDKKHKIMVELEKFKEASLKLSFWGEFISKNIIIPGEEDNNKE